MARQRPDGSWRSEVVSDVRSPAQFVLLQAILGRKADPRIDVIARGILADQAPEGGWFAGKNGPVDVSVSVEAYAALKVAGQSSESEPLRRARAAILDAGGAEAACSRTHYLLAALGQIPYSFCPALPPELLLLPTLGRLSIPRMSPAALPVLVPLSVLWAKEAASSLPRHLGVAELFRLPIGGGAAPPSARFEGRLFSWPNAYRALDRVTRVVGRAAPDSVRRRGLKAAERWLVEHFERSDGLAGGFTPTALARAALWALGYADDSAEAAWLDRKLEAFLIDDVERIRVQPTLAPVRDTAWSIVAAVEAGEKPDDESIRRAAEWLLPRENREPGDGPRAGKEHEASGWPLQEENRFFPEIGTTATVLAALERTARFTDEEVQRATHRAVCWILGRVGTNKGWPRFGPGADDPRLAALRWSDAASTSDPVDPAVTGAVLEALGRLGYRRGKDFLDDAIRYLVDCQHPDGGWRDASGGRGIHATWRALAGLSAVRFDLQHPRMVRAAQWLKGLQTEGGGWCDPDATGAPSEEASVVETAWAVLGLMAAGEVRSREVRRGIESLLSMQLEDGSWKDAAFTSYLPAFGQRAAFGGDALVFPTLALARYRTLLGGTC